ncbi:Integrase catalytic core protein [Phytophthora palmivora]|uniref:Integrase catalytic core protein n=1 Tax=Phytophthora palmivora TaxID=4796 RepID=A0A2P4X2J5_9STRA|nr:Integrase catalytic core protein [Phytophthora palmivora]
MPTPRSLKQALSGPHREQWKQALELEYDSLIENGTWRLVRLPPGPDGTIERFKARLVAQGNHQAFGVDCDEVYAPVARFESLRLVLAIGTILDCHIHQMDVHTAFLNGTMEGEQKIYMRQPHGFMKRGHEHLVCELQKSIYGLKQAPRIWYRVLHTFLTSMGFARCHKEICIYVQKVGEELF